MTGENGFMRQHTYFDLRPARNGLICFSKQLFHDLFIEIGLATGITHLSGNVLNNDGHSAPLKRHGRMTGA